MSFSDLPFEVGPVYEGERIRGNQMYIELGGPKIEKHFELVRVKPEKEIEDGKITIIGPNIKDMEEGGRYPIGILVEVSGPELEEDLLKLAVRYSGPEEEARTAASGFLDQGRIEIRSMRKGRKCTSDVRPFFSDFKIVRDVIFFNIKELEGSKPRLSDLARALRSLDSCRTIEIQEIKILRSGFSSGNGPET